MDALPTIKDNKIFWENPQYWEKIDDGDYWSRQWGSPSSQWVRTIFPRIHKYLPTGRILEIAPGFGRWTQYLKELCRELAVVDLSEICIERCRERFSSSKHIEYHVNDGKTLDMIPDKSIDFVFSFDSLVHADDGVIESYLTQLASKLKPNGVGWFHHSNLGEYKLFFPRNKVLRFGISFGLSNFLGFDRGGRDWTMTAKKFEQFTEKAGLQTISQEKINWLNRPYFLIDCISVFTPRNSQFARPNSILSNGHFMDEVNSARNLCVLYG